MKNRSNSRGFTLIELLVVVSIITLLISILLPAVGAARTRARVSACVQNMKQHGIGLANYAAANGDTLPNAPIAPPDNSANPQHGLPGRTARMFATTTFPVNGFSFNGDGPITWSPLSFSLSGLLNNSEQWAYLSMNFNAYWIVMSQYMTDQEGIAALQDVFYSPSDTRGKDIRDTRSKPYLNQNGGKWPAISQMTGTGTFVTPTYRYVPCGVISPTTFDVDISGGRQASDLDLETAQIAQGNYLQKKFYSYIRRLPSSSVDFPSQKVMFFLHEAVHNSNRDLWFEPGAICPVALADGSARETIPDRDAIDGRRQAAIKERAGSWLTLVYRFSNDDPNQNDVTVSYYAPYLVSRGGVRGRDL